MTQGEKGDRLTRAALELADVEGVSFDVDCLFEDLKALSLACVGEIEFDEAVHSTKRALELVSRDRVSTSELSRDYEGWRCYHYRRRDANGERATMRLMFRKGERGMTYVRGFGDRRLPEDFYRRMAGDARPGVC